MVSSGDSYRPSSNSGTLLWPSGLQFLHHSDYSHDAAQRFNEEEMEGEEDESGNGSKPLMRTPVVIKRALDYGKGAEELSEEVQEGRKPA